MITCQTYTFREDGKHTLNLTLPCFSGSTPDKNDEDFYAAARMNRFYGKTAGFQPHGDAQGFMEQAT